MWKGINRLETIHAHRVCAGGYFQYVSKIPIQSIGRILQFGTSWEVNSQLHAPAALLPGKEPSIPIG
jgi:hypothetical protein